MTIKDVQVRKMMEELNAHGHKGVAALRAGMDRKTGSKYAQLGKLPSELTQPRAYRTRPDPFEGDWPWVEAQIADAPDLEAKILFEALQEHRPGKYQNGQLRTLQRKLKQWRAEHGPDRRVFFAQEHRAGEAMQVDFTYGAELGVSIAGVAFAHLICHVVFPYSNWQQVTVCLSESFLALKRGIQDAVFRIGRTPSFTQTDNSTAATHDLRTGKRGFNAEYDRFIKHLGMTPRTISLGHKEQNGDVEASNGALKRRLAQELMLRGNADFETVEAYEEWLRNVVARRNRGRQKRFNEELVAMRKVDVRRLAEFVEMDVRVTSWSTIRVKHCAYSVPSRLIGERVRVRIYERTLDVYYGGRFQFELERLKGRSQHRINYRHVIWSLVQKPGAFARYRYREELFPTLVFRQAYDANAAARPNIEGDIEYLRLLHLAAATTEAEVEEAIRKVLEQGACPTADRVKDTIGKEEIEIPELMPLEPELADFDELLSEVAR